MIKIVDNNKNPMFRIVLLIFIFLYFSWNFFYGFVINYIPFRNAQNINLYNYYTLFEENSFSWFMNNETQTWITYNKWNWEILLEKFRVNSYSGILMKLPYKSWHRYWEQLEIFVPIINDLWDVVQNDNSYSWISLKHKNNLIKWWEHYLLYWIDYSKINDISEIYNTWLIQDSHNIFLNKLYLIKTGTSPANYIVR